MTKKLKWFKTGEAIPLTATYISSKISEENFKRIDCCCPASLSCDCHTSDMVSYHLYEVLND